MHFQFDMSASAHPPVDAPAPPAEISGLLREMLDVQREQLNAVRGFLAGHDGMARWRAFLERWRGDFPDLSDSCRQAMPILERTYGKLISELSDYLGQNGSDVLDNEFSLQEFLDRYGMRLTQLGTILSMVAPFAEARSPSEQT